MAGFASNAAVLGLCDTVAHACSIHLRVVATGFAFGITRDGVVMVAVPVGPVFAFGMELTPVGPTITRG